MINIATKLLLEHGKSWGLTLTVITIDGLNLIKESFSLLLIVATLVLTMVKIYQAVKQKKGGSGE